MIPMENKATIIEIEDAYTAYEGADRPTLHGISLSVRKGEFIIVGGPNGAGKTTLLETINGMLPITHGRITVCGYDIRNDGVLVRSSVGYLLQNFSFDPLTPFTVREVVMMGRFGKMGLFRKPGKEDYDAVAKALALLESGISLTALSATSPEDSSRRCCLPRTLPGTRKFSSWMNPSPTWTCLPGKPSTVSSPGWLSMGLR